MSVARSTLQLLKSGRESIERGVHLNNAKTEILFEDTTQSMIVTRGLGLVVEIERYLISTRTKEAPPKRKREGMKLGRPVGL